MKILRRGDYKMMAWKNGGGITTEIAVHPAESWLGGEPFQWRVSIADVAVDGAFSTFSGYDRHIMLLEGNGMKLEMGGSDVLDLTLPYRPAHFSGDQAVFGRLNDGPVRDFNLMVARHAGRGTLLCQELSTALPLTGDGATRLIHCIDGKLSAGEHVIGSGETLILAETESATLAPLADTARIAICTISYQGHGARI